MFDNKNEKIALQLIVSLIKDKYGFRKDSVKGSMTENIGEAKIELLDQQYGADIDKIASYNERPIAFLKTHNGVASKKEHEDHFYWSYSVITLKTADFDKIIEGLNVFPEKQQESDNQHYSKVARC